MGLPVLSWFPLDLVFGFWFLVGLEALPGLVANNGSLRSIVVSSLFGFWFLVGLEALPGLVANNGSHRSIIPSTFWAWHKHWMGIDPTQVFPFSSLTVAWYCCSWRRRRPWGRCRMIALLSWKCHGGWRMRTGWKTRWRAWNHNRNEAFRIARYPNPVFNETWFLTVDPFIRISVFIAKLSKRQDCWRLLEDFHSQEYIQFFDVHCGLFMRLHFSIGGYDYPTTTRLRQGIHVNRIQVLFADHVHRRAGVDNKFSFLRFKIWWRQAPIFRRWEECCFVFSLNFETLLASFHAASRAHCSCHSVSSWDRSSNFGAFGLRWWGSPGHIIPSNGFWSRMYAWRATTFVNFTRRIGFRMSVLFRKIDEDFGGSISWNTQPNCRVLDELHTTGLSVLSRDSCFFTMATALLSPFFLDLLLGCSSTWRCA